MKKHILTILFVVLLCLLPACTNKKEEPINEKKEQYSDTLKPKEGNVTLTLLSDKAEDLFNGAVKTDNLKLMFDFLESVKEKKPAEMVINVINKEGKSSINKLNFNGESTTFVNNYEGFLMEKGNHTCKYIEADYRGMYASGCDDLDYSQVVLSYTSKDYYSARNEYLKERD